MLIFLEKNLKALVERHCLSLWSIGSQLIISKCSVLMCSLLSNCKQKCIYLFCKTCNLFLYFVFKFGYLFKFGYHWVWRCRNTSKPWWFITSRSIILDFRHSIFPRWDRSGKWRFIYVIFSGYVWPNFTHWIHPLQIFLLISIEICQEI